MVEMLRSLEREEMEVLFIALFSPGDGEGGGSPRGRRGVGWPGNWESIRTFSSEKKLFNDTFSKCERVPCEGGGWRGYGVKVQH